MIIRYLVKEFFKTYFQFFISLILLFWIADFFANISIFLKSNASLIIILKYFLFKTPQALYYIIPFATLATGMFLFSRLNFGYELVAFRTLGVKITSIYRILLYIGLTFYLFLFINNEFLTPKTYYQSKIIKNVYLKKIRNYAVLKANKIWYKKENFILKIDIANFDSGFMKNITLFKLNNFDIVQRFDADLGFYINKKWLLYNVDIYNFDKYGLLNYKKLDRCPMPIDIKKNDFVVISYENKNLSFFQIINILKNLRGSSIDTTKYKTDLIDKFTYPFVSIFFIIISFLLNLKNPREKATISVSIYSVIICFGFYILHSIFINFAYMKLLPYFIAPFLIFIMLFFLVYFLHKKVRY